MPEPGWDCDGATGGDRSDTTEIDGMFRIRRIGRMSCAVVAGGGGAYGGSCGQDSKNGLCELHSCGYDSMHRDCVKRGCYDRDVENCMLKRRKEEKSNTRPKCEKKYFFVQF